MIRVSYFALISTAAALTVVLFRIVFDDCGSVPLTTSRMASKLFRAVILGAPASGKGTISARIVKNFNLVHVSSGDLLRMNVQNNTDLGQEVKSYLHDGKLVPDSLMLKLITDKLEEVKTENWLLDGFPRTLAQAKEFWTHQLLDIVINLCVPYEVIIERTKGRWVHLPSGRVYNNDFNAPKIPGKDDVTGEDLTQRDDDKPEIVKRRLDDYDNLTKPVIDFYKEQQVLHDFHGKTSDEIWPKVKIRLTEFLGEPLQN